jgi:hypothetical protein
MKHQFAFLLLFTLWTCTCSGQRIFASLYGGFSLGDKVSETFYTGQYFRGNVDGNGIWGVSLEHESKKQVITELHYLRNETRAPLEYFILGKEELRTAFDVKLNYILFETSRPIKTKNKNIVLRAGILGGLYFGRVMNPDSGHRESLSDGALAFRIGCIYWLGKHIGIQANTQVITHRDLVGGRAFFGPGDLRVIPRYKAEIYQFGISAGIIYSIWQKREGIE